MLPNTPAEQRAAALAKAAEARRMRAEVKELLSTGSLTLAEVFARSETDEVLAGTKIVPIVVSLPGMGKVTTKRLLEELGISETKRIRGLGTRQREALLARLS